MSKAAKRLIIILSALLLLAALGFFAWWYFTSRTPNGKLDLHRLPDETQTVSMLVVGVDESHELTDVIIYLQFDPEKKKASMLSIPRDTYLGDEFLTGKINAVYQTAGGIERLVEEVRERFLLPVDYYATVTLETLRALVDDIGGVTVTISEDLYDHGNLVFSAGTQTLDGARAETFVRLRYAYVNADLGRIDAQHQFLLALMEKVQTQNKLDMLQLVISYFNDIETDLPLDRALSIASTAFSLNQESISAFTVPGVGKTHNTYAVYEVDKKALAAILNENFFKTPVAPETLGFPLVNAPKGAAALKPAPRPEKEEPASSTPAAHEKKESASSQKSKDEEEKKSSQPVVGKKKSSSSSKGEVVGNVFEENKAAQND